MSDRKASNAQDVMSEPLRLEEASAELKPVADDRPRMPEPLPVRLVAIEDVTLPAPPDLEDQLDDLYIHLLEFERIKNDLAYRADNYILRFKQLDQPVPHESLRPQGIEVLSLALTEKKLIEAEIEYTRQRSLTPGAETLLLLDPAGNWLENSERRIVP